MRTWTPWPPLLGISMLLFVVGLTVALLLAAVSLVAGLVFVALWSVAVARREHREAPRLGEGTWFDGAAWGALVFAFIALVFQVASLRMLHAHGLLDEAAWAPAYQEIASWLNGAGTLLLLASGGVAVAAAARGGDGEGVGVALLGAAGSGLFAWLLLGLDAVAILSQEGGFSRTAFAWIVGLDGVLLLSGLVLLATVGALVAGKRLPPGRSGPAGGVAILWATLVVVWLLAYLAVYLKVLRFPFHIT